MKDILHLGVVNFNSVWGDKDTNLRHILEYCDAASRNGIQLLAFPETALSGYDTEPNIHTSEERMQRKLAEPLSGEAVQKIAAFTKKANMYIIFGMPERDAEQPGRVYNAAVVVGPQGTIGSARKIHLPFSESLWADRGERPFLFDTPWGPIGVGICYDFYCFPEVSRYCRAMGARLFINCTAIASAETGGAGGYLGNLALAYHVMNNDMFVASSNLCGTDITSWFMGGSSIIGPSIIPTHIHYYAGKKFLEPGAAEPGIQDATIDLSAVRHSFLQYVWPNKENHGDWRPDQYIDWYTNFTKS